MKREWKFEHESEAIIVSSDASEKPRSRLRRVLGFTGKTVFILLLSILPALIIALGIHGLLTGEMPTKHGKTLHGDAAISCSWCFIAIGNLWFGGILAELTGRPLLKWLSWAATTVMFITSLLYLVRAFSKI